MKPFIFAFVIAIVLEDYEAFQAKSIASSKPEEQVELFKKYALDLVLAAIPPLLKNGTIVEGGCECRLDTDKYLNPVDLALETMCMAIDHRADLEAIRDAEDLSTILKKNKINVGLMENIRRILTVLENWSDDIDSVFMIKMMKTYLLKYKQTLSGLTTEISDEEVELTMKCYNSLNSFEFDNNTGFFDDLYEGFGIVSDLMRADAEKVEGDEPWNELNTIIGRISGYELHTRYQKFTKEEFRKLLDWLSGKDAVKDTLFEGLFEQINSQEKQSHEEQQELLFTNMN